MITWFAFSLFYVILASIANILRKVLLTDKRSDAVGSAILFQFMGCAIVAVFAFFNGFVFPPLQEYFVNFLILASFWGISTLALFKAYQYSEASVVTVLVTSEAVVTIVAAQLILHETFTLLNIIGTVFIIFAVLFMATNSSKITFNRGVFYSMVSALFAGLAIVNDTFMLKHVPVFSYLTIGFFLPGLFILLVNPRVITKMKPLFQPSVLGKNALFTLVFTLAGICFYLAIAKGGEASQVNTIAQSNVVLTVLFASIFLNERDHLLKKFVCAILVSIGVILLR